MMSVVVLAKLTEISNGQAKGFDPLNNGQDSMFIVRQDDKAYAYVDICPHYGSTTLPWKKDRYLSADNKHIVCAAHRAVFDIQDGTCVNGPCLGQALKKIEIVVSSDHEIRINLDTLRNAINESMR